MHIAGRVLVMAGGRIVEDGTPAELIGGQGRFAELHAAWREPVTAPAKSVASAGWRLKELAP